MIKGILTILLIGQLSFLFGRLEVGTIAPDFNLETVYNTESGDLLTLSGLKGKVIVLDFWATWCTPCVAAMPDNNSLYQDYKDQDVVFIGITDEKAATVTSFLEKVDIQFPVGISKGGIDFKNYEITSRPTMVVINREGKIVYSGHGVSDGLLKEVVEGGNIEKKERNHENSAVLLCGGFSPGEDPMYNGMRMMIGRKRSKKEDITRQFIIRPSLDSIFRGSGYSQTQEMVGFTYWCGSIEDVLTFFQGYPSNIWIKNYSSHKGRYDVIYKQRSTDIEASRLEVLIAVLDAFTVKIDTVNKVQKVNTLFQDTPHIHVVAAEEVDASLKNTYLEATFFAEKMEALTGEFYLIDSTLEGKSIFVLDNEKMNLRDFYMASDPEKVRDFLIGLGIMVKSEKKEIETFTIRPI